MTNSDDARFHIQRLKASGLSASDLLQRSKVDKSTVRKLLNGAEVHEAVCDRVLAVGHRYVRPERTPRVPSTWEWSAGWEQRGGVMRPKRVVR